MTTPTPHGAPELPAIYDDDRAFLHYNPNTDDLVEFVQDYARAAIQQAAGAVPEAQKEGSSDHLVPCAGGGVTQWLPIETAPRDGTFVFLYSPKDESRWWAAWQDGIWYGVDEYGLTREGHSPTRWMPPPPAPTSQINPGSAASGQGGEL